LDEKTDIIIKTVGENQDEIQKLNKKCEAFFNQNNSLINKFDLVLSSSADDIDETFNECKNINIIIFDSFIILYDRFLIIYYINYFLGDGERCSETNDEARIVSYERMLPWATEVYLEHHHTEFYSKFSEVRWTGFYNTNIHPKVRFLLFILNK